MPGRREWTYLSFADDDGFLGAAVVRAPNVPIAAMRAHMLGINPGGEVLGFRISQADVDEHVPPADRERLLTKADLARLDGAASN